MTKLRITREARDDLRDIRRFSKARFGAAIAKEYMVAFETRFTLLLERPEIGPLQEDLALGTRAFSSGSHRIYYRVVASGVEIVRVLHQAQSDARDHLG